MALIDKPIPHHECTLSDTAVFSPILIQSDIVEGTYEEIFPLGKLEDAGPIEFNITSTSHFLDLASTFMKLKVQILKKDGTAITEDATNVTFVNNIVSTLFDQIDVYLGGQIITSSSSMYGFRAILEVLLNYGNESKTSQHQLGLFYKDTAGHMNETDPTKANTGLNSRHKITKKSSMVELIGRIHSDIFNQGKFILNGLPLRLILHRNKDTFCLMADEDLYKVSITDAMLYVRKATLDSEKFKEIQQQLERTPAIYAIDRVSMYSRSVPAGLHSLNWDNVVMGQLPKKMFICMCDNDAFNGNIKKNPFNFAHYHTSSVGVFVNGQSRPGRPIKVDFSKKLYSEGYLSLYTGTAKFGLDEGIAISWDDFAKGYSIFAFDLSPALCRGGHQEQVQKGAIRISLEFEKSLANTITVIAYCQYDNHISVDKFRNILKNF